MDITVLGNFKPYFASTYSKTFRTSMSRRVLAENFCLEHFREVIVNILPVTNEDHNHPVLLRVYFINCAIISRLHTPKMRRMQRLPSLPWVNRKFRKRPLHPRPIRIVELSKSLRRSRVKQNLKNQIA